MVSVSTFEGRTIHRSRSGELYFQWRGLALQGSLRDLIDVPVADVDPDALEVEIWFPESHLIGTHRYQSALLVILDDQLSPFEGVEIKGLSCGHVGSLVVDELGLFLVEQVAFLVIRIFDGVLGLVDLEISATHEDDTLRALREIGVEILPLDSRP